jgi:hypothetical protein
LADDANIYKLVGPVLLKQDTSEAKSTVDGRLEYIGGEMYANERPRKFDINTNRVSASGSRSASRRSQRRVRARRWR